MDVQLLFFVGADFLPQAEDLIITRATILKEKPDPSTLVFGTVFTDHMLTVEWSLELDGRNHASNLFKPLTASGFIGFALCCGSKYLEINGGDILVFTVVTIASSAQRALGQCGLYLVLTRGNHKCLYKQLD